MWIYFKKITQGELGQEWGKLDFHSLLKVSIFYCFVLFFQKEQEPKIQVFSKLFQDLVTLPDMAERQKKKKKSNMNSTGWLWGLHAFTHVFMNEAACMKMHTLQPFPPVSLHWLKEYGLWVPSLSDTSLQHVGQGVCLPPDPPLGSIMAGVVRSGDFQGLFQF